MRFFSFLHLAVVIFGGLFSCDHHAAAAARTSTKHDNGVLVGRSNKKTTISSSVFSDKQASPFAADIDNLLLGRKSSPSAMLRNKMNSILLHCRGGAVAKKRAVSSPSTPRCYKKHVVWGTPTMPAFLYPILDAAFIVAYPCVALFLLSGRARVVHAIIAVGHIPLAMLTDYSCTSRKYPKAILFPNWPVLPLKFMYLFDATWCVFASLSPFFLEYPNRMFDYIFHAIGIMAFGLLGFMDPQPSSA
jgi:hypothetical protein